MASKQATAPPSEASKFEIELSGAFSLFRPSIAALRRNFFAFFYLYSMALIVAICGGVILLGTIHAHPLTRDILFGAGGLALAAALGVLLVSLPALSYAQLQSVRGEMVEYTEALAAGRYYFRRLWAVRLFSTLIILGGFILLIVPGFFMMRRYLLASYIVLDKDISAGDALRLSVALSKEYDKPIWGVVGVQSLLFAISFIPFIGSVITICGNVAYYCGPAARYEEIMRIEAELEKRQKRATRKALEKTARKTSNKNKRQSRVKKAS